MSMFEKLLPRHLQIIYALNQRHLDVSVGGAVRRMTEMGGAVGGVTEMGGAQGCTPAKGPLLASGPVLWVGVFGKLLVSPHT